MTEENPNPDPEETEETEEPEGTEEQPEETEENPELKKVIRARDRAKADLRKAREELAKLKEGKEKPEEEDKAAKANAKLIGAEARAQLSALGITDREDQKAVITALNLSDISVDDDGDVDSDEIEERLTRLRDIFTPKENGRRTRVPRTDPKDRGGDKDTNTDPDKARYNRILGRK